MLVRHLVFTALAPIKQWLTNAKRNPHLQALTPYDTAGMAVKNEESDEPYKNVTFRAPEELIERLDEAVFRAKVDGEISRDTSRSDVLRELVENYCEEREV